MISLEIDEMSLHLGRDYSFQLAYDNLAVTRGPVPLLNHWHSGYIHLWSESSELIVCEKSVEMIMWIEVQMHSDFTPSAKRIQGRIQPGRGVVSWPPARESNKVKGFLTV